MTTASGAPSFNDLPDEPHVAERIDYRALQHPPNRFWSIHLMLMFFNGTMLDGPDGQGFPLHRNGIVNE